MICCSTCQTVTVIITELHLDLTSDYWHDAQAHVETLKRIQEDREIQKERLGNTQCHKRMATDAANVTDPVVDGSANEPRPCVDETSLLQVWLCCTNNFCYSNNK